MLRLLLAVSFTFLTHAQTRQVVITIDDLPRGGDDASAYDLKSVREMTMKLVAPLRGTSTIGFVNPGRTSAKELGNDGLQAVLKIWRDHGLDLGNHSFSHLNLNETALDSYEADILKAEPAIRQARDGITPVYFRHPFLFTEKDAPTRKHLKTFLAGHGYRIAPVTLDNSDYIFAAVYAHAMRADAMKARRVRESYLQYIDSIFGFFERRSIEVAGREFPQILLIHANQLNADTMPDLLALMKRRGYRFVSLEEALRDLVYQMPDEYFGGWGISWIHRWSFTKGMPEQREPDEPAWIMDEFKRSNRTR